MRQASDDHSARSQERPISWLAAFKAASAALTRAPDMAAIEAALENIAREQYGAVSRVRLLDASALSDAPFPDPLRVVSYRAQVVGAQQALAIPDCASELSLGTEAAARFDARAYLALPLVAGGRTLGVWELRWPAARTWSAEELDFAGALAALAGPALASTARAEGIEAALLRETRERADHLAAINAVAETLAQSLDLETMLDAALKKALEVVGVQAGAISLLDEEARELVIRVHRGWRHEQLAADMRVPVDEGLSAQALNTGEIVVTGDLSEDPRVAVPAFRYEGVHAMALAPLPARGRVMGILSAMSYQPFEFKPHALAVLKSIAGQIGVAIDNARLYEIERHRRRQMESIQVTVAALSAELDIGPLLALITQEATRTFDAPAVAVFLWDEAGRNLVVRASHGLSDDYVRVQRLPRARIDPLADAAGRHHPIVIPNLLLQPFGDIELIARENIVSALAAPMQSGSGLLGWFIVYSRGHVRKFTPDERDLAELFSRYAAVAIENAQLFDKARRRAEELTLLHQVSVATTSMLNLDDLLAEIYAQVSRLLNTRSFYIALYDQEHDELDFRLIYDGGRRLEPLREPVAADTLTGWIVRHGRPILIGDWEREAASVPVPGSIVGEGENPRSYMGHPLIARERIIGVISAQSERPDAFNADTQYLLAAIANQAAVAIDNAQLFEEARHRVQELSALQATTLQLSAALDLATVLDTIATSALQLVAADNLHIFLYNEERDEYLFGCALSRDGTRTSVVEQPRKNGLTATVVREQRPIVIDDAPNHPLYASPEARRWGVQAIAGFPLMRAGRVLGMLSAAFLAPHRFTPDELRILALLSDHAAIAVENARLYEDAQRRLDEVSTLYTLSRQTTGSLDLDTVLEAVVTSLKQVLECRACSIALLNPLTDVLEIRAASGIDERWLSEARLRLGEGIAGRAALENRQVYVADTLLDPSFIFFDRSVRSLLCVPLSVKSRVIGTLSIDSDRPDAFAGIDERMLTIAAAQAAVAIENAQLYRDLKERAEKLERAYEELKEVDRLKDELVQNISHELRTPLTFVKGYVDLLIAEDLGPLTPGQRDSLRIVSTKTNAVTRLVSDIVSLQQLETAGLQIEAIDLVELARTAREGAAALAAENNLELALEAPVAQQIVAGDRQRLTQVFDNLLGNAIKFSPNGGRIVVRVEDDGRYVRVSVRDPGIGIAADQVDKIWQRFYQVDGSATRRYGGTGLGLAIVQRIVQAHGGRAGVDSELGHGSAFYFTVPRVEAA